MTVVGKLRSLKNRIMSSLTPQPEEGYCTSVERRYRMAGLVITVLLVIFMLASLIFGYREWTYENVYYFFRELDTVLSSDARPAGSISYGSGEVRSYAAFKGGIAVADRYSVSVYSAGGRRTAELNVGYFTPQLRTSDKYLLIYESGGGAFSVCNSFVRLYSETLDGTIYSADINARGEVLVHTSSSKYSAVLYLYGSGFSREAAYYIGDYVTACALSDDGRYVLAATADARGGEYASALRLYRRGETESTVLLDVDGELILSCGAFSDGFYAVTDRGIYLLDRAGGLRGDVELGAGQSPVALEIGEDCLALTARDANGYSLLLATSAGESREMRLDSAPLALGIAGRRAYVLLDGAVAEYDLLGSGSSTLLECAPGGLDMVVTAARRVLVCYATEAVYYDLAEGRK